MSFEPFPERIDPRKLFTRNGTLEGVIPLVRMPRLREYLCSNEAVIRAKIGFERNADKHCLVSGTVSAKVRMLCQRCLKETDVELDSTLNVLALNDKQYERVVNSLPEGVEAVQSSEDELDVHGLIEDELILSLPTVAYHHEKDCNEALNKLKVVAQENEPVSTHKAFASLQSLRDEFKKE